MPEIDFADPIIRRNFIHITFKQNVSGCAFTAKSLLDEEHGLSNFRFFVYEVFNLENPKGELIKDGEFFFLEGNNGIFNKPQQILELKGKVIFSDKKMFSFNTSEATMDFNKKVIVGEKKVKGKKINSTIFAEGFKIEQKTNKIIFKGKSKLVLSKKTN